MGLYVISWDDSVAGWNARFAVEDGGQIETTGGLVGTGDTADEAITDLETQSQEEEYDGGYEYDDSMDGDHESALASAGWGTDEDYGSFGIHETDEY